MFSPSFVRGDITGMASRNPVKLQEIKRPDGRAVNTPPGLTETLLVPGVRLMPHFRISPPSASKHILCNSSEVR